MTGLDALRARGWKVDPKLGVSLPARTALHRGHIAAINYHNDDDTAVWMAVAAALVAEGHDLIGLLRDARPLIDSDDAMTPALLARVDAVLAAVDGPQ